MELYMPAVLLNLKVNNLLHVAEQVPKLEPSWVIVADFKLASRKALHSAE